MYILWAFPVAQRVKNPPTVQETWVQSLGWEDPLEEEMASHSSILAWRIPTDRGAQPGRKESETTEPLTEETVYMSKLGYSKMPSCFTVDH